MNKTENKKTVTKIYFNKSPKFEIHYQVRPISFLNPFEPKIQHSFFLVTLLHLRSKLLLVSLLF
ncbi:hypothetical protein JHK82_045044 [Glycine max]|uniref:Uncharacterized protein n=1 Tax=Glycine max TaxID=3847 RepID=K7MHB3_SOYBN|nr:hypothetical protein JHK86_045461 [Glycine max]KAG4952174.1 hypothetical protein JHK85_046041 [Glycine max]KAG5099992.1 hypothetical protein JHK82_045044 [Glycine max]KAG5108594.1 hypothetical protein JHK84_045501 [Glycine max]KAH1151392.1 hypothetical protein GYH30_045074 [Glycine max]